MAFLDLQMTEVDINKRLRHFLDSATEMLLAQNYNDAIRELKAAEVLDRHNPRILYNLGIAYARTGLHRTASSYFERLLELPASFVDSQKVRKLYAFAKVKTGDFREAEEIIDRVISLSPSDIPAHNMKGYCLEKQGNIEEAMKAYLAVMEIDEKNSNACNSLAWLMAVKGKDLEKALHYAGIACRAEPENAAYLDTMGYVCMKMRRYAESGKYLEKALKIHPFSDEIKGHLSELDTLKKGA